LAQSFAASSDAPGAPPTPEHLRLLIRRAADALASHPKDEKHRRAVEMTYLRPAPTQEAAADRLGVPFSTYRRHLTRGVERIVEWLWEAELHGVPADSR
jgi:DNA-directed RNA polymerase specialized sigma24 family protein